MTPFAEVRLDTGFVVYRTIGGSGYNTNVIIVNSGREQRNKNWENSRGVWEYGDRRVSSTELHSLEGFFRLRNGRFQGFRFRDWGDFKATHDPLTEFNVVTQGVMVPVEGSTRICQMYKKYSDVDTDHSDTTELRLISKPILTTAPRVWKNLVEMEEGSQWEVDLSKGLVTFTSDFIEEDEFFWEGEFDTPVRFDVDQFKAQVIAGIPAEDGDNGRTLSEVYFQISTLPLIELRI